MRQPTGHLLSNRHDFGEMYMIDSEDTTVVLRKAGALAGKVCGAGGGGFMMFIVAPVKRSRVMSGLQELPGSLCTCNVVEEGAHSWRVTREM
jgi:galactokinase/mevalonate kinase-like predicted kinase